MQWSGIEPQYLWGVLVPEKNCESQVRIGEENGDVKCYADGKNSTWKVSAVRAGTFGENTI